MIDQTALDTVVQLSKFAQYSKPIQIFDGPDGLTGTGFGTSGLDTDPSIGKPYDINVDLIPYLVKLDYSTYISDCYDCEDRAFWGMSHLRKRFPGCRVGVASGFAPAGHPCADQEHAVIILWYEGAGGLEPAYFDPITKGIIQPGLNNLASVIAFPVPVDAEPDTVKPLVGMHRLDNEALLYDKERLLYPLRDPKIGILDYIEKGICEKDCDEIAHHDKDPSVSKRTFEDLWTDYDRSLWSFVHVRRAFRGCPVGVAIGDYGTSALSIWYEDDSGNRKHMYLDPYSKTQINFSPKMIFM